MQLENFEAKNEGHNSFSIHHHHELIQNSENNAKVYHIIT